MTDKLKVVSINKGKEEVKEVKRESLYRVKYLNNTHDIVTEDIECDLISSENGLLIFLNRVKEDENAYEFIFGIGSDKVFTIEAIEEEKENVSK